MLDGVRVVDVGRYVAGPVCAALLGDLGAEVIRVERVDGGEDRGIVPLAPDGDGGALYLQANRGKRGMTLNPTREAGAEVLRRLVATADVVVANLPERALVALGLDAASVHAVRPDAVLVTADAFGPGPWAHRLGFDGIGQVMSGAAHLSGPPDEPAKAAALWVDYGTAALGALGAVAALLGRSQHGGGDHVRTALLHTALSVVGPSLTEESVTAPDRVGTGNRAQTVGPADIVATADGHVIVQVVGDPMFARFARMVGRPELVDDPRLATDLDRGAARDQLAAIAAEFCGARTTEEVLAAFEEAGLATAPVLRPAEVLEHPHVVAAGMLTEVPYPGVEPTPVVPTSPVRFAATPTAPTRRAPLLGEHTDEILHELGYDDAEVAVMRADRVV